jgi:predicted amidohydrolase YtcJ
VTRGGSSAREAAKATIAEGRLADFVMLAEDPHDVEPVRLRDVRVLRTVAGGRTTYEA